MRPDLEQIRVAVRRRTSSESWRWLESAIGDVAVNQEEIRALFPAAGRKVGKAPLEPGADPRDPHAWTTDDAGRTLLLAALGHRVIEELEKLYRYGDAAERRGVLRALPYLSVGDEGVSLVDDALRTNDTRLIAAALGPYAFGRLDDARLFHGLLKCVFLEVPISPLERLEERANPELARMLAGYVHERVAAGREVPAEVWPLIDRFPPPTELAAIHEELQDPGEERRSAARRTLADRQAQRRSYENL